MISSVVSLVGRCLLALIFILSGLSKIGEYANTVDFMSSMGVPFAPFFLYAAVLVEIGGGVCLITGYRARVGALLLVLFLVPVTYLFHLSPAMSMELQGSPQQTTQMINSLKNLAIIGGLLMVYANGPGGFSIGKRA